MRAEVKVVLLPQLVEPPVKDEPLWGVVLFGVVPYRLREAARPAADVPPTSCDEPFVGVPAPGGVANDPPSDVSERGAGFDERGMAPD